MLDSPVIVPERDATAQERDATAQERDATAQERDATAQERDATAQERDATAQESDVTAASDAIVQERDATAQERDATAQERDATAQESDVTAQESDAIVQEIDLGKPNPLPLDLDQAVQALYCLAPNLEFYGFFRVWATTFSQEYTEGDQFYPQAIEPSQARLIEMLTPIVAEISSEQLGLLLRDLDEDILPCHNVLKLLISTALESALESDQHVLEDAEASLALQARYSFFKPLNILMIQMDSAESNRGIGDLEMLQCNLQDLIGALDEKFDEAAVTLRDIKSALYYELLNTSYYELLNTSHELTFQDFEVFFQTLLTPSEDDVSDDSFQGYADYLAELCRQVGRLAADHALSLADETLSEDEAVEAVAQDNPVDLHAIRAGAFCGLMMSLLGWVVLEFLPFSLQVHCLNNALLLQPPHPQIKFHLHSERASSTARRPTCLHSSAR